jgi:CheY-like chemotaxis protein
MTERLFTLLGDEPHDEAGDALGFDEVADKLARLVLSSSDSTPFALGIEAGWGMGKSSLMARLRDHLERSDEPVATVAFNAWTADDGRVLEGILKTVLGAVDQRVLRAAMRDRRFLNHVRLGTRVAGRVLRMGDAVDLLWEEMSDDPRARNQVSKLVGEAMCRWRATDDRRVLCVFVDDLDRCSPDSVFEVFEAIKLYLDAKGLVFIIGYDADVISESILEQKSYASTVTSRHYLEKIVQITYRVRRPGDEQSQRLLQGFLQRSGTAGLFDQATTSLVVERNDRNPRRIKRFINRFVLDYRLDADWERLGPASLVRVLVLETYFPAFLRLLEDGGGGDPVEEFHRYVAARQALRRRTGEDDPNWTTVKVAFAAYDIGLPAGQPAHDALLELLEREVPVPFRELADDADFASLVAGLGDSGQRDVLRAKLERRRREPLADLPIKHALVRLDGVRILWVDDRPETVAEYRDLLERQGATVQQVTGSRAAQEVLRTAPVDLLISDIGRANQPPDVGFDDLRRFRGSGLFRGPAIFFTSRVTQARQEAAAELEATITATTDELWAAVAAAHDRIVRGTGDGAARREPPKVFIDYREADAAYGRRLGALFESELAATVTTPEDPLGGADRSQTVADAARSADAVIEVIGPGWVAASDRLGEPEDSAHMAMSVATGFYGPNLVPVLVGGAQLPDRAALPDTLAGVLRQGRPFELHDDSFETDAAPVLAAVRRAVRMRAAAA